MNVKNHLLVVFVVIGTQFVMTGLKRGDTIFVIIDAFCQVFEDLLLVAFEVLKLLRNFA